MRRSLIGPRLSFLLLVVVVGLLGLRALNQLWEQDVFWQVKAGTELLQTGVFPHVESWSYTAAGQPWQNFQWLATLLMAFVYHLGGIAGLVFLRALIFVVVLTTLVWTLRSGTRKYNDSIVCVTTALVGCAMCSRVQMRPDFIMLVPFTFLGLLWRQTWSLATRWISSFLIVVLCANIHPGCALFAVGFAALLAWGHLEGMAKRGAFVLSMFGGWCLTPYFQEMPDYLGRYVFYSQKAPLANPDFESFGWHDFGAFGFGLYAQAFVICVVMALAAMVVGLWSRSWKKSFWNTLDNQVMTGFAMIFLVFMSLNHQRVIPFAVIILAPLVADGLSLVLDKIPRWGEAILLLGTGMMLTIHVLIKQPSWGLSLDQTIYPMECLRFIAEHHPMPQLLHEMKDGDAVVGLLPEYRVFADTREVPFDHLALPMRAMYDDPSAMAQALDEYQINTVMMPLRFFQFKARKGDLPFLRRLQFFPMSKWAVVAFDNKGILLLRRIPQHAALIERYGYSYVIPDVPPDAYMKDTDRTAESDAIFTRELERCLADMPRADYCLLVKARFLRHSQTATARDDAERFLRERLRSDPTNINILHELEVLAAEKAISRPEAASL